MEIKNISVGTRIWFEEEKSPYKVRAMSKRYVIATKPFNLHKTYFYVIIDLKKGVRGPGNKKLSYETSEDCLNRLSDLENGVIKIDYENSIPCLVSKIK